MVPWVSILIRNVCFLLGNVSACMCLPMGVCVCAGVPRHHECCMLQGVISVTVSERYKISNGQVSHVVKSAGVSPLVCSNTLPHPLPHYPCLRAVGTSMTGSLGVGLCVKNPVWGTTQDLPKTWGCVVLLVVLLCVYVHVSMCVWGRGGGAQEVWGK